MLLHYFEYFLTSEVCYFLISAMRCFIFLFSIVPLPSRDFKRLSDTRCAEWRTSSWTKFHGLRTPLSSSTAVGASTDTGSAVNGVSQLVLSDKL